MESVKLDLTEAVDAAAKAFAEKNRGIWDQMDPMAQLQIKEYILAPVKAAAPFIINQIIIDIASRTYEIQ